MMVLCFVQQCVDCDWLRWNDRKGVFFCPLFNWVIRDIYRRRTLEIQAKMGVNWPPESRNRNWDNIFMLSVRKDVLWVRVIFVCICSHLSNCHFNDTIVNKGDICRIPTFRSSLRGSFVAPLSLLSSSGWSPELKSFPSSANKSTSVESCCFV